MRRLLLPVAWVFVMLTVAPAQAPEPTLFRIFSNPAVFGKDFGAALRSLPAWNAYGEREVAVFANQIVGATPQKSKEDAQKRATQLSETLLKVQAQFKGEFDALAKPPAAGLRAEAILFPEDDSYRVATVDSSLQFLNRELTLARLRDALGAPQKITYLTVQNKFERRPIQLTLYVYADGQLAFAEPNPSLRPGSIDRVLFNVRAITGAVFQEAR